MAKIQVNKPFTYNSPEGVKTPFPVGEFEVGNEVANHWFVKVHCDILKGKKAKKVTTDKTADNNE